MGGASIMGGGVVVSDVLVLVSDVVVQHDPVDFDSFVISCIHRSFNQFFFFPVD